MSRESLARNIQPAPEELPVNEPDTYPGFANDNEVTAPEPKEVPEAANDNEVLPAQHVIHPEAANDNESSQPISTIYSEAPPVVAANDNEADKAKIAEIRESLAARVRAEAVSEKVREMPEATPGRMEGETEPTPERPEPEAENTQPAPEPTENIPQNLQAAGGAERIQGNGGGAATGGPVSTMLKKGFGLLWKGIKGAIKLTGFLAMLAFNALVWTGATAVEKTTEGAFKALDSKGSAGGAKSSPPKKH